MDWPDHSFVQFYLSGNISSFIEYLTQGHVQEKEWSSEKNSPEENLERKDCFILSSAIECQHEWFCCFCIEWYGNLNWILPRPCHHSHLPGVTNENQSNHQVQVIWNILALCIFELRFLKYGFFFLGKNHVCKFIGCGRNDKFNYVVMQLQVRSWPLHFIKIDHHPQNAFCENLTTIQQKHGFLRKCNL